MPRKPKQPTAKALAWRDGLATLQAPALSPEEAIDLGRLGKAWGLKGDQRLQLYNPDLASLRSQRFVYLGEDAPEVACSLAFVGIRSGKPIIRLEGIDSPEAAKKLVGKNIWIARSALPELDEDELYLQDLLGMQVRTLEGLTLGTVDDFLDNGAQDVLVVRSDTEEILIPLVEPIVQEIDLDTAIILVDFVPAD